jgi:hypothetical protein
MDSVTYQIIIGVITVVAVILTTVNSIRVHRENASNTDSILTLNRESKELAIESAEQQRKAYEDLRDKTEKIDSLQAELLRLQAELMAAQQQNAEAVIAENEYRNFRSGIAFVDERVEDIVREWFTRVKAIGFNPPRYSKIIYIHIHFRTMDPTIATTHITYGENRDMIFCRFDRIAVWRGLTSVLFGKEIEPIPKEAELPALEDALMYNGFLLQKYYDADEGKKRQYWLEMLDLFRTELRM